MTEREMLALVRRYATAGRWDVELGHGVPRMRQRGVTFPDIEHALLHATGCLVQPNERWLLTSTDRDGDDLRLVAVVADNVLVITVF